MKWLVIDSLYCDEQMFCSHLESTAHYLKEAGEEAFMCRAEPWMIGLTTTWARVADVALIMDRYEIANDILDRGEARKAIAQVAAVTPVRPWDVRRPDGSPAFSLILSSIPAMVEQARAAGCRAEYQALAFDTRARVCGMGVKRDIDCLFIGTVGPNHERREKLLRELSDVVTVLPTVFGREYFRCLARARVVLNIHAEWAQGVANNMRIFEAGGMECQVVSDGQWPGHLAGWPAPFLPFSSPSEAREAIAMALHGELRSEPDSRWDTGDIWENHTYVERIPSLIELARSL